MRKTHRLSLVKFEDNDFVFDIRADYENDTLWLTQEEMAILFDVDRTRISRHISNIYRDEELNKNSTCAESAHMGSLGLQSYSTKFYNLDMIISVGYRINSKRGIIFRRWANKVLKDYLIQGNPYEMETIVKLIMNLLLM